ncbi:hypothetical protein [Blastococcus montanus]|uniref:hypothetical protein n=1 Tax=Blastococcus montanus TaxID=3144973 RepID=UPI00320B93CC
MSRTRMVGLALATAATALWAFFVVALAATDPADGANIGAGLGGLLAFVLSVAALIVLLVSLRSQGDASGRRPREARIGAPLAMVSLVLLGAFWVRSASVSSVTSGTAVLVALGAGIVTFVASAVCFMPQRRPRA